MWAMSESEDSSWLSRLSAEEWLRAAQGELARAELALRHKQQRAGVTQARRAAGMAWNAVLHGIADLDERARYGRSYMDHLRVLCDDVGVSARVREAAAELVAAPLEQVLVQLGAGDVRVASAAAVIVEEAKLRAHVKDPS
jgi:HEPN domain-containing protein